MDLVTIVKGMGSGPLVANIRSPVILMELNGSTVEKAYIYANGQIIAQHAGVSFEPAGKWTFVRAKHELFYGYEWMVEGLLNTGMMGSPQFDQLLTNQTEFWNSVPVIY